MFSASARAMSAIIRARQAMSRVLAALYGPAAALALRLIDDEAKVAGLVTPGLDSYRAVARRIERVA
jgi:predicted HD phosphohydrolase